jgi:hypothetical protein
VILGIGLSLTIDGCGRSFHAAGAPQGAMQGPRYTTFAKLTAAKKFTDLTGKT